jgi:uroporphyrin-III C-methyltransferase/precorrin-2 dehydrogenase/sirohydrochlorin ferrochelatase
MANVSRQNSVSWSGALSDLACGVGSLATDGPVLIAVGEVFASVGQAAEAAPYHEMEPRAAAAN